MSITSFFSRRAQRREVGARDLGEVLRGHSIEVMPRTAAKVEDFRALLAPGTRIYVAHIEGTDFEEMLATARRLRSEGFPVMPHVPARLVGSRQELETWVRRYREEAGVEEALLLAGGAATPRGDFTDSMQLLETGAFDRYGFRRLHVAGHPEGNRDIDADGTTRQVDAALLWKQAYADRTDAEMAIVTQFVFDARPVIEWVERIRAAGVALPVHVGIAGPAKLQTLIKFAVSCGVGPSMSVLQKRARDLTKLILPYEPSDVVQAIAAYRAEHPDGPIEAMHVFPLGGIIASADWIARHRGEAAAPRRSAGA